MISAFWVTVINVLGTILGVCSTMLIAARFGAGIDMDVYVAGMSVPIFLTAVASGSIGYTAVPVLSRVVHQEDSDRAISACLNVFTLVSLVVTIFFFNSATPILSVIASGLHESVLQDSAKILRVGILSLPFSVITEVLSGAGFSRKVFIFPFITRIIPPLLLITLVFFGSSHMSTLSMAWSVTLAAVLQATALVAFGTHTGWFRYHFKARNHPAMVQSFRLMLPLIAGMFVYRAIPVFDRFVLSLLPQGSLSIFNYSSVMVGSVCPILMTGIATTSFQKLSATSGNHETADFLHTAESALDAAVILSLPVIVCVFLYAKPMTALLLEHGLFDTNLTRSVAEVLALHVMILLPAATGTVTSQVLYSLHKMRLVAFLGVLEFLLYVIVCYPLAKFTGIKGMIWATILYWYLSLMISMTVVRQVTGWRVLPFILKSARIATLSLIILCIGFGMVQLNIPWVISLCMLCFVYLVMLRWFAPNNDFCRIEILLIKLFHRSA